MTAFLDPKRLLQQINNDITACETLLLLLQQERDALNNRDIDALDQIIEQKTVQLTHLENSAQQRTEWARANSDSVDLQEIQHAWLAILEQANIPIIQEQWGKLKELQQQCKAANEVNGKILARNQKTFNRLMEIVRGQTASPNLYSAAGKSTSQHISRKMGEA